MVEMKVLITGGSRGIGKAIVEMYVRNGYSVTAPTRTELDLLSRDSVKQFIKENEDGFDIIINDAGLNDVNMVGELKENEFDEMIAVNLIAPYMLTNGFIKKMANKQFGRIVNIASIWSVVSKPGRSVYSSTKRGLHGLTTTLALEYGRFNVLSNTVSPGYTVTDLTRKNNNEEQIKAICETIPQKRMASVDEISKVVYFLGSPENTYINGQNIVVDGGYSIC